MARGKKNITISVNAKDNASKKLTGIQKFLKNHFVVTIGDVTRTIRAMGRTVINAIKDYAQFETKIKNVANLVGGGDDAFKAFSATVREVAKETPQAMGDLADALFDVVSAGVSAADSQEVLLAAAKLATAGVTDTKTAVDGLTSVMNAYGMEAKDVTKISDIFFAAQVEGKTTIAELSSTIGRVAPIAKAAGIELEELMAATTTLTKAGLSTDEAVTSLRGTITAIISPTSQAKNAAAALGIDLSAAALESKGLRGVLQELQQQTGGNIEDISTLIPNVRALGGVLSLAGTQADEFERIMGELGHSAGSTERAFVSQTNSLSAQWTMLTNRFSSFSKTVIEPWAKGLAGVLGQINKLLVAQSKIPHEYKMTRKEIEAINEELIKEQIALMEKIKLLETSRGITRAAEKERRQELEETRKKFNEISEERTRLEKRLTLMEEEEAAIRKQNREASIVEQGNDFAEASEKIIKQTRADRNQLLREHNRYFAQQRSLRDVSVQEELEALQTIYDAELGTVEQREALELRLFQYRQQIREQEEADIQSSIDAEKAMREAAANDLAALMASEYKHSFAVGKAAALYNIGIKTYEAAMGAYNALVGIPIVGPALGVGAAAAAFSFGAQQGLKVASTPAPAKFAHGGLVSPRPGGTNVVMGEAGETELGLPASKVKAFLDEAGVSRGATTINVPVYLDGKQIAQVVTTHQKANQRRKT